MSRFVAPVASGVGTRSVSLGPCECPGTPHDEDTAEVLEVLGWDDLVDVGEAPSEGAGRRLLVTRAVASWTLEEPGPDGRNRPVPVTEATVRLLDPRTLAMLADAVNEAYLRTKAPLPNGSGAGSPRSPRGKGKSSTKATATTAPPSR